MIKFGVPPLELQKDSNFVVRKYQIWDDQIYSLEVLMMEICKVQCLEMVI